MITVTTWDRTHDTTDLHEDHKSFEVG